MEASRDAGALRALDARLHRRAEALLKIIRASLDPLPLRRSLSRRHEDVRSVGNPSAFRSSISR
jgi:hypothetical protein